MIGNIHKIGIYDQAKYYLDSQERLLSRSFDDYFGDSKRFLKAWQSCSTWEKVTTTLL